MIGGEKEAVAAPRPDLQDARAGPRRRSSARRAATKPRGTAEEGYLHCGPAGAGHFVKMVHNGIEYGMMQAYAEGFDILKHADVDSAGAVDAETAPLPRPRLQIDVADIAEVWRRGSVVGSWLLDLAAMALAEEPRADRVQRPRAGLRRGPLDDHGGDRGGRARARC